jgi:hypothetical protein
MVPKDASTRAQAVGFLVAGLWFLVQLVRLARREETGKQ